MNYSEFSSTEIELELMSIIKYRNKKIDLIAWGKHYDTMPNCKNKIDFCVISVLTFD